MLNRLTAAFVALLICASPAAAWPVHGAAGGGGSAPAVLPGVVQPTYDNSNSTSTLTLLTNVNYANIAPVYHGSSGDNGYNARTWAQWNDIPLVFVSGTRHIGLLAAHMPTDTEKAAGLANNIADVKVRCDEGSYATINAPTANPDAGGMTDWNFTVSDTAFADGLHKCDAIIEPATGPDGVMNGPPFDVHGSGYAYLKAPQIWIDSGTRGTAGHILTIPTGETTDGSNSAVLNFNGNNIALTSATISYGWSVTAYGVAPGTFIDGDSTHNATSCAAETGSNCTGAGGAGTYHLTGPSQTVYGGVLTAKIDNGSGASGNIVTVTGIVTPAGIGNGVPMLDGAGVTANSIIDGSGQGGASCGAGCTGTGGAGTYHTNTAQLVTSRTIYASTPAVLGDQGSFYFVTNFNGTLGRPTVYFCAGTCNGVTGNDSTGLGTAASPYATIAKAQSRANAADNATTFHNGKWGVTICMMNPGTVVGYSGSFAQPDASLSYEDIQSANTAPCSAPGDAPGVTISQNPTLTTRSFLNAKHIRWRYVNISTPPSNQSGNSAQYFVADHATEVGDQQGNSGLMGTGGWMCLESTVWFGSDGACSGARMVRNTTAKYAYQDCFHDVYQLYGNTCENSGYPATWLPAIYSSATPLTPSSVLLAPAELSGYALSQILNVGGVTYTLIDGSGNNCFSGAGVATLASVNDAGHSVTFNTATASGLCTNGATVYLSAIGAHPDDFQLQGGGIFGNVFIVNNAFNVNAGGGDQGAFIEMELIDGVYMAGNSFKVNPIIGHTIDAVNGGNSNVIYSANSFLNSGSFVHDRYLGEKNGTYSKDLCGSGGTFIPPTTAGVNVRALAATSGGCYTTTTP